MSGTVYEQTFICAGCGQRVVLFAGPANTTHCATCTHLPGWQHDAHLRKIFGFDLAEDNRVTQRDPP